MLSCFVYRLCLVTAACSWTCLLLPAASSAVPWQVGDGIVKTLVLQHGKVLVGGSLFPSPTNRMNVVRFHLDGSIDHAFNPIRLRGESIYGYARVNKLLVEETGNIMVIGGWTLLERHFPDGFYDPSFSYRDLRGHEATDGAFQSDGKLVFCGFIFHIQSRSDGIFRLKADGSFDPAFSLHGEGYLGATVLCLDRKERILTNPLYKGMERLSFSLLRFTKDGALDLSFEPQPSDGNSPRVTAVAADSEGRILIADSSFNRNRLYRVTEDGIVDRTFLPEEPDGPINTILIQSNAIVAGGGFKRWGAQPVPGIARVDLSGFLDETFYTGGEIQGVIHALLQLPSGDILAGGNFSQFDGLAFSSIVQLSSTPVVIRNITLGPGTLHFSIRAAAGSTAILESSPDLRTWVSVLRTNISSQPHPISLALNGSKTLFLRASSDASSNQ